MGWAARPGSTGGGYAHLPVTQIYNQSSTSECPAPPKKLILTFLLGVRKPCCAGTPCRPPTAVSDKRMEKLRKGPRENHVNRDSATHEHTHTYTHTHIHTLSIISPSLTLFLSLPLPLPLSLRRPVLGWSCGNIVGTAGDVASFLYDLLGPDAKVRPLLCLAIPYLPRRPPPVADYTVTVI